MKVRAASAMTSADFAKHIDARHNGQGELSSLTRIDERAVRSPKDRAVWEAYHNRLHETREYQHEHGPAH